MVEALKPNLHVERPSVHGRVMINISTRNRQVRTSRTCIADLVAVVFIV